jgi:serine/arginine repetitive matrix protein 2
MPSTFSIDRFPSVNPSAVNPSTVRFDEHTMSGALDSHVPNQFPGQNPSTYAKSDFEPNPHGAAADYYKDRGQSVKHQPGERAFTPKVPGSSSVAPPSGSTKPTKPTNSTKQSSSSSSSVKPSRKPSSRGISPPAASFIVPAAAAASAVTGAYVKSSSRKSSRAVSPPAEDRHMQARASTQYEPSAVSQNNYRPAPSDFSVMPPSEFSAMPASEFSAMPPSEFSAMPPTAISRIPHSAISGQPPRPVRYNSEPPPTVGAASSYYEGSEMAPSRPAQSGMLPSSQANHNNNIGKYAVAGAAAAGMAAYGISQHRLSRLSKLSILSTLNRHSTTMTHRDMAHSRNTALNPKLPSLPAGLDHTTIRLPEPCLWVCITATNTRDRYHD